jgi:hypothetical protein
MTRRPVAVSIAAIVFGLAACGGSSRSSSSSPTSSASSAGTSSATTPDSVEVGDIPDTQVYVPFLDPAGVYTISVPQGWAQRTDATGVTFTDKLNAVTVTSAAQPTAPTDTSAVTPDVPADHKVSTVSRKAGSAILITYQTDSTPDEVTGKSRRLAVERYVFWKAAKQVTVTLSGAVGADNVDPWRTVTDSLTWS